MIGWNKEVIAEGESFEKRIYLYNYFYVTIVCVGRRLDDDAEDNIGRYGAS